MDILRTFRRLGHDQGKHPMDFTAYLLQQNELAVIDDTKDVIPSTLHGGKVYFLILE